jgi:hypothetical protein
MSMIPRHASSGISDLMFAGSNAMGRTTNAGIDTGYQEIGMENEEDDEDGLGMFDLNALLKSNESFVRTCNVCLSDKPCNCVCDLVMD